MNAWLRAIERATSADEIVSQARDFCSLISPRDLAAFPEDVRQIRIDHHDDIQRLRERLEACAGAAKERAFDAERVGDLLAYMSRASARLGEVPPHSSL
jgi:hypothetical protein